MYLVYKCGGPDDGKVIASFDDERDAVAYCKHWWQEHEDHLESAWDSVFAVDDAGALVDW